VYCPPRWPRRSKCRSASISARTIGLGIPPHPIPPTRSLCFNADFRYLGPFAYVNHHAYLLLRRNTRSSGREFGAK
jgi:hypothetical protein